MNNYDYPQCEPSTLSSSDKLRMRLRSALELETIEENTLKPGDLITNKSFYSSSFMDVVWIMTSSTSAEIYYNIPTNNGMGGYRKKIEIDYDNISKLKIKNPDALIPFMV